MQTITPPNCPNCDAVLETATAKTGNTYYRCPNWLPNNRGCEGYQWFPPKNTSTGRNGVPRVSNYQRQEKTPVSGQRMNVGNILFEILLAQQHTNEILERYLPDLALNRVEHNDEIPIIEEANEKAQMVEDEEDIPVEKIPF